MKRLRNWTTWAGAWGAAGIAAGACLSCCITFPLAMAPLLAGLGISAVSFEFGGFLIAAGAVMLGWAAIAWLRQRRRVACKDGSCAATCSGKRSVGAHDASPIACTLSRADFTERVRWLRELTKRSLLAHRIEGRKLSLTYKRSAAAEIERFVRAEAECCAFLNFEVFPTEDTIEVIVSLPAEAAQDAKALFGHLTQAS